MRRIVGLLLAVIPQLLGAQAPAAKYVVTCVPLSCLVDGHLSTGAIVRYRWTWGDGKITENRNPPTPYAAHPYAVAGSYSVKLQVLDAAGRTDSMTRTMVVPPITVIHDTTIVRLPAPPAIHDTTIVRLPTVHDTTFVSLPAPPAIHDTLTIRLPAVHDTVQLAAVHDTVFTGAPVIPGGCVVEEPFGERWVRCNGQRLGRLIPAPGNLIDVARYTGVSQTPGTPCYSMRMPVQATVQTQGEAVRLLMLPWTPPPGFPC